MAAADHNPFVNETSFYNQMVLSHLLPASLWEPLPHFLQTWLRNYLAANMLYFISGFLWCFYIYYVKLNVYVPKESIPTRKTMIKHISVAMKAMPWQSLLPTVTEYMVEHGWTLCYSTVDHFNWFLCFLYIALYLALVEFGVYFIHKELHDNKFLYKHLHATHHIYNKQKTISPFSGLWTANIHDYIHGDIWPVMGAGYHTVHHKTYKHNYGHYTIYMDWMFGSLKAPLAEEEDNFKEK